MKADYVHSRAEHKPRLCVCGGLVSFEKCKEKNMARACCKKCGITTPWEKTIWDSALSWEKQIIQQGENK